MGVSHSPVSSSCLAQLEAPHHHLAWVLRNGSSACSCKHNNIQLNINKHTQACAVVDNFSTGSMHTRRCTKKKKRLNPLALTYTALPAIHIASSACRENYKRNLCAQSKVCMLFYFLCPCFFFLVSRDTVGDVTWMSYYLTLTWNTWELVIRNCNLIPSKLKQRIFLRNSTWLPQDNPILLGCACLESKQWFS